MERDPFRRWPELDELFRRALDLPPAQRPSYLESACAHRDELRATLEALLEAHDGADGFLDDLADWLPEPPEPSGGSLDNTARTPGTRVSHYELLEVVGRGGMGVVYKARDTRLGRLVTLKFLHPHLLADPGATERFVQEARAASALDHPGICTVHDVAEADDGSLFIVMAYYPGETLKERIARGPLPVTEAVGAALRIAEALARAHEAGIVHRDLKPANIILTARGEVKVLDFGIAKLEGGGDLTRAGLRLGTVSYMSPEQAAGDSVDHRSDVWALGVVLHEMLTGARPFRGGSEQVVLEAIRHEDPPPLDPNVEGGAPGVGGIVARALAKDPGERYRDMGEMIAELRALAGAEGVRAAPGSRRRSRRRGGEWALTAAAGAAVVLGGYAVLHERTNTPRDPVLALPQGPVIAVVPFENVGPDPSQEYFAKGLTEDLITSLGRFSDLFVLASAATAPHGGPTPDVDAIGRTLGAAYALVGTVQQQESRVRVTVRLLDTSSQNTIWSETFDRDLSATELFSVQDEITQRVAGALGGPTGLLGRRLAAAARSRRTDRLDSYQCVLRAYDYLVNHYPANHAIARDCLEGVVAADPDYVDAWGWLAYVYAEESRHGWNRLDDDPLGRALATAEQAIRLEPTNFMAQASLAVVRFDRHEVGLFVEAAERAMALNPNDATWLAVFGGYLVEIGQRDRGIAILDKARALNPNHPGWLYVDYASAEYHKGNYQAALDYALRINLPDYYRGLIWQIAVYGQVGRKAEARAAYGHLLELRPDLVNEGSIRQDFRQYNHPDEVLDHVMEGMRKSGIWDPR